MSSNQTPDPVAFREFEHAGWTSNVSEYEAAFTRVTSQAVGPLLDAVNLRHGSRLLDVATGPGHVAAAAAARGAKALGVDFSAPMVAHARTINPAAEFREGDAEALAFEDRSFDAVVMNFGMLHLARPERAMTEAARVLKPGGCFAFTVWAKPEEAMGFGIVLKAIQSHGDPGVQLPQGPSFFRFSDPAECERTLRESGFVDVRVTSVPQVWRFNAPGELFDALYNGAVRMKAVLRAQSSEALEAIRTAASEAARNFNRNGMIELPMPAVLASAVKPPAA
jgi:ubiquinone/menaquinone biosynthesis C-methylase UbiE